MPTFCFACHHKLADDGESLPAGPCPRCTFEGATVWYAPGKEFYVTVQESSARSVPPGKKRWDRHSTTRRSIFKQNGHLHLVERTIDRVANEYYECVLDCDTGEVVREVREPLTKHTGRGSARRQSASPGAA